jgi:hypothetical protein
MSRQGGRHGQDVRGGEKKTVEGLIPKHGGYRNLTQV